MIETIQYKKCTCDICGAVISIPISQGSPGDWETITFRTAGITIFDLDACKHCADAVADFIKNLQESKGENHDKG